MTSYAYTYANSRLYKTAALAIIAACLVTASGAVAAVQTGTHKPVPLELKLPASPQPWQRYKVDSQGSTWPQADWSAYSTMSTIATAPPGGPLRLPLPIEGDPAKGRALAFDRARGGSCVACHIFGKDTPPQPGNVGPDLSAIGAARDDNWLFNYVYDPRLYNKDSIMPPWGAHHIFSVAEIRDIVAFLKTLKEPYHFSDRLEDPATRTPPSETRDNLDPTENPAMFMLDQGKDVYNRNGPSGKSCNTCHAHPEVTFKTWAAHMPRYEPRLDKILGVEEFITRHARVTTGDEILMQSADSLGLSIYLRNFANGTPIDPDTSSGAKLAARRGQELMHRKIGQLNMACVDCHDKARHANHWARGQYLVELKGAIAHFPTWRTSRGDVWDIRKRFQWCNVSVRANELPPDAREYGDIEMALVLFNKGEKINSPGIRH